VFEAAEALEQALEQVLDEVLAGARFDAAQLDALVEVFVNELARVMAGLEATLRLEAEGESRP
jgi:hypothetical protein